jgi:molybdenum cofactor synthesis domain-containing protein
VSTAGLIIIGNEVLSAKVSDENGPFLIRELRDLGVRLMRIAVIRDDVERIARDVREMSAEYTWVFTTGGVGSTHDDVTVEAIARAFDVPLEKHAVLLGLIEQHYGDRANEAALRMALLPRGADLVGMGEIPFPVARMKNVFIFPGVPSFLRTKFAVLRPLLRQDPFVLRQIFVRVGETTIAKAMTEVAAESPDVEIGSYPRFDTQEYRVKITVESQSKERVEAALGKLIDRFDPAWIVRVE